MIHREGRRGNRAVCGIELNGQDSDATALEFYLEGLGERGEVKPDFCRWCWTASLTAVVQRDIRQSSEYVKRIETGADAPEGKKQ